MKPDAVVPDAFLDPDWLEAIVKERHPQLTHVREVVELVLDYLDNRESPTGLKLWRVKSC